jgi:hypothetical protein
MTASTVFARRVRRFFDPLGPEGRHSPGMTTASRDPERGAAGAEPKTLPRAKPKAEPKGLPEALRK